jgi:hypothetical protein
MRLADHYVGTDNSGRNYYQMGADYYTYTPNTGGQEWHWITCRNILAGDHQTLAQHLAKFGETIKQAG